MTEKDDKIFTPILVAVLGFFGAAIAPSVQFVNGCWNYQLKQQEIAHKIVLDLAQLAIQEGVSQEYQRDTLNVIASISGNPLETWAEARLKKHQDTEEKLRYIVSKRFTVQKYESLEECQTHLKEQKELFLREGMQRKNINSCQRMAMFLAQIGHESGSFRHKESIISGDIYEGRRDLGNREPGDGKRFKERGLIFLAGRTNYEQFSEYLGKSEILSNPDIVASDPFLSVESALWYWESRKVNVVADSGDVKAVTRLINGGYNGLADRTAFYERAIQALSKDQ